MLIYVVKEGDTVDSIAAAHNVSPDSIFYINQIPYPFRLAVGQSLLLPAGPPPSPYRTAIYTGGYAYPFINPGILSETLPFLSYLYIFSYGFTMEGALVPPRLDDTFMITMAKAQGTAPVLTLTPFILTAFSTMP